MVSLEVSEQPLRSFFSQQRAPLRGFITLILLEVGTIFENFIKPMQLFCPFCVARLGLLEALTHQPRTPLRDFATQPLRGWRELWNTLQRQWFIQSVGVGLGFLEVFLCIDHSVPLRGLTNTAS